MGSKSILWDAKLIKHSLAFNKRWALTVKSKLLKVNLTCESSNLSFSTIAQFTPEIKLETVKSIQYVHTPTAEL